MIGRIRTRRAPAGYLAYAAGLLVGALLACVAAAHGQGPDVTPKHTWSPEVGEALAAYRAGNYSGTQQLCERLLGRSGEADWRRDAAAIEAFCLLRMPARADRVEGRTRLAQLMQEDPALRDEPECDLAYGIAQTAMSETATALDALEHAAAGFARQGQNERSAGTLVALAEAWATHGEWEATPPQLGVKRPADATEANATRRSQIEAVRARIEGLPDHADALARVDLVLARFLIASGMAPDEARAVLTRLAGVKELTAVAAEAAVELAGQYEARQQWNEALPLYERVRHEWRGDLAHRAEERVLDITRPQIAVEVPGAIRCGQSVPVRLRVRGLTAVKLEVRQVDVDAWLGGAQTRVGEAFLPESGSLREARELDTRAPSAYDWWQSDGLAQPLDFTADAGAYVVLVKGEGSEKRTEAVKRLVVISDLEALCCVSPRDVLVWAARGASADVTTARFWMNRSFAPTDVKLNENMARFPLPNEARVMREKGWVCLVRSGQQLAICRGHLPAASAAAESGPRVALLAGPPKAAVGGTLYVAGLLLPGAGAPPELPGGARLALQVTDALDKAHYTAEAELSAGGAFSVDVPIPAGWAGKYLRVLARYRGQALDNVLGRAAVSVPRQNAPQFRVRIDVSGWLRMAPAILHGVVRAEYPWGAVPVRADGRCTFRATQLPAAATNDEPVLGVGVETRGRLDEHGRMAFEVPLAAFGLKNGPFAIDVDATVSSWEGRTGTGHVEALLGAEPPYAWLTHQPAKPAVGDAVRFRLGWSSPGGLAVPRTPDIEIQRAGSQVVRLHLHPGLKGFTSEVWRPTEAGLYDVATTLAAVGTEPLRVSQVVEVGPAVATTQPGAQVRCAAHFTQQGGRAAIQVKLDGEWATPLLVLVAGSDPLAARSIAGLSGTAELTVALTEEPRAGLRVLAVGSGVDGFEILCAEEVAPDPEHEPTLSLVGPGSDVWPGTTANVQATCRASGSATQASTLTAWLTDATTTGYVDPRLGRQEPAAASAAGLEWASSTRQPVNSAAPEKDEEPTGGTSEHTWAILREGDTLWSMSGTAGTGEAEFPVPVPSTPGLYRLAVLARTPEGGMATDAIILDARRGIRLAVDCPARLLLGDRSLVAVQVENGYAQPVEARLRCQAGEGLHIEAMRVENAGQKYAAPAPAEPVNVTIPAGGAVWLRADVEAARVATGRVVVDVTAHGKQESAAGAYEVLPAEVTPANANAVVKRTVSVWTQVGPGADTDSDEHPEQRWRWVPVAAGQQLLPGQIVQVRDEATLREACPELTWTLCLPATCRPMLRGEPGPQSLGGGSGDQIDTLIYKVPKAAAGVQTHEWHLAIVRPGACVLPAPGLRCGDLDLSVAVDPAEVRLIVSEGD